MKWITENKPTSQLVIRSSRIIVSILRRKKKIIKFTIFFAHTKIVPALRLLVCPTKISDFCLNSKKDVLMKH